MRLQVVLLPLLKAILANNVNHSKSAIYFAAIVAVYAAYYVFDSGADITERVVLLPRSPATTALPDNLATSKSALPPVTTRTEPSLEEQIKALEASGALPNLDRSTGIKGPDQNLNGVRDDIDAWIAALQITEIQKKAATQNAKSTQNALLVNLTDQVALQAVADESVAGIVCLKDTFEPNYQEGSKLSAKLEAMTVNTKERTMQYIKYNRARSGSVTSLPNGNTCK